MIPQNHCPKCKKLLPGSIFHMVIPPGQEHLYFCRCEQYEWPKPARVIKRWYDAYARPPKVWCHEPI